MKLPVTLFRVLMTGKQLILTILNEPGFTVSWPTTSSWGASTLGPSRSFAPLSQPIDQPITEPAPWHQLPSLPPNKLSALMMFTTGHTYHLPPRGAGAGGKGLGLWGSTCAFYLRTSLIDWQNFSWHIVDETQLPSKSCQSAAPIIWCLSCR